MQRIVILATAAVLAIGPGAAFAAAGDANQATSAATISDGTIGKVGAALHDVAKLQEKYQGPINAASPSQKQGLSEQANAEAMQAIRSHGISVQEYSNVVPTAQNNPQVKQRLLEAVRQNQ